MSTQIGIAVLGVGRWGTHLVRNFLADPQAKVRALVDLHPDHLTAAAEKFDLPGDAILTDDWQQVLQLPDVDAVAIATPAVTHYALISAALNQGCHVLAEKPLTLKLDESLTLCRLAQQKQRRLVVDHTYLFNPAIERGQTIVQSGTLGTLRYGYASRTHLSPVRQDVDALWDLAIHDIAIFNTWLGELPNQVRANGSVWLQPNSPNPDRFLQGLADLVWVQLTYPSGFQATIHLCWLNPDKQRRLAVVGNQSALIFDELAATPLTLQHGRLERQLRQDGTSRYVPAEQRCEVVSLSDEETLQRVCKHFLTCIRQNTASPISSGWVGAQLVQILDALTASLQQNGKPISVIPFHPEMPDSALQ